MGAANLPPSSRSGLDVWIDTHRWKYGRRDWFIAAEARFRSNEYVQAYMLIAEGVRAEAPIDPARPPEPPPQGGWAHSVRISQRRVRPAVVAIGVIGVIALVGFAVLSDPSFRRTTKAISSKELDASVPNGFVPDLSVEEIARRASRVTLLLIMQDPRGRTRGIASGFVVGQDLVVTNYHVVAKGTKGIAKLVSGDDDRWEFPIGALLAADKEHDLALISVPQIAPHVGSPLPFDLGDPQIGSAIYAIGNPEGLTGTFSNGIVSAIRAGDGRRVIQITAPISPGSSGGPVVNQAGHVVGVATAGLTDGQNLNFAIPANYVLEALNAVADVDATAGVRTAYRPLANGQELMFARNKGVGELTIQNGNERDGVVTLRSAERPQRAIYVRAGAEVVLRRIAAGSYVLRFGLGHYWDNTTHRFRSNAESSEFLDPVVFRETEQGYRRFYSKIRITLHSTPNGNAGARKLADDDLGGHPKPAINRHFKTGN